MSTWIDHKSVWIKLHSARFDGSTDRLAKGDPIFLRRSEVAAVVDGSHHVTIHLSSGRAFAVAETARRIGELMGRDDDYMEVIK